MAKILIVDDEESIRKLLTSSLERKGHQCIAVEDGFRAVDVYDPYFPDVVVSDIKMPRLTGFQMLDRLKEKFTTSLAPVVFITGHGEKSAAIESLRKGAFDYLEKPFDMDEFFHVVDRAAMRFKLEQDNQRLTGELAIANKKLADRLEARTQLVRRERKMHEPTITLDLLGNSPVMGSVKQAIEQFTKNPIGVDTTVLITGPSGAGKEVVARLLHDQSPRAPGPWVALNCGALPETLIESELFGHEKGAFTGAAARHSGVFEMADGGTLFLDEIGELPLHLQSRLLRAIQERSFRRVGGKEEIQVDVRIIAATNRDLKMLVSEKKFREDLFYRLNVLPVHLPPLCDRGDDILTIARYLLTEATKTVPNAKYTFSDEAKKLLLDHDWPGNVRELKAIVQRVAVLNQGTTISETALRMAMGKTASVTAMPRPLLVANNMPTTETTSPGAASAASNIPYHSWKKNFMKTVERDYLKEKLVSFKGNVSALSRAMKVTRPNLCRLLKRHGLKADSFRDKNAA